MVVVALLFGLVWLYFWCKGHWFAGVVGTALWGWPVFGLCKMAGLDNTALVLTATLSAFCISMLPTIVRFCILHGETVQYWSIPNPLQPRPSPAMRRPTYDEIVTAERTRDEQRRDRMASATPQRPRTAVRLLEHSAVHTGADAD